MVPTDNTSKDVLRILVFGDSIATWDVDHVLCMAHVTDLL